MVDKLEPTEPDHKPDTQEPDSTRQLLFDAARDAASEPTRTAPPEHKDSVNKADPVPLPSLTLVDSRLDDGNPAKDPAPSKGADRSPPAGEPIRKVDNFARTTLTYPQSGRVIELDGKGTPIKISETDGTTWSLTSRNKNEWTNNNNETQVLKLADGQYSYTDNDKSQVTYKKDGTVERAWSDGTSFATRDDLLTSITGDDKKKISFEYAGDKLQGVADAHGSNWQLKPGTKDEWTLIGDRSVRTVTGSVESFGDGTYKFTGSGKNEGLTITNHPDGQSDELSPGLELHRSPDGSSVKVKTDPTTNKWTGVSTFDAAGNLTGGLALRKRDDQPLKNQWTDSRRDDLIGQPHLGPSNELLFRSRNPDGSFIETDQRGRTAKIEYPGGGSRAFEYDKKSDIAKVTAVSSETGDKSTWTRIGNSDWWKSNLGQASQRQDVKVENGRYSFNRPGEFATAFDTKGTEYIFRQPSEPSLDKERDLLKQTAAELIKEPKEAQAFKQDMEAFEARAKARNLPDTEVARSYSQLLRLMLPTSGATVPHEVRVRTAQQAIHLAADPTSLDQGRHPTCNVATVESYTYTKAPSKALEVVASVATNGNFVTKDGTILDLAPSTFKPEAGSDTVPIGENHRSFASQLFQMTAANAYWQRQTKFDDQKVTRGTIAYQLDVAKPGAGDDGARLVNTTTGMPMENVTNSPRIPYRGLPEIYEQLTTLAPGTMVLAASGEAGRGVLDLDSENHMHLELTRLARAGELPVILHMHPSQPPFSVPGEGGDHESHVVTITDYKDRHALVDNQWGRTNDFLGRKRTFGGKESPENPREAKHSGVPLKQLYRATTPELLRPTP